MNASVPWLTHSLYLHSTSADGVEMTSLESPSVEQSDDDCDLGAEYEVTASWNGGEAAEVCRLACLLLFVSCHFHLCVLPLRS